MTLKNEEFARAVVLAPVYETAPLDGIARKIVHDMTGGDPITADKLVDLITIHLTALNMSRAAIVRNEWQRAAQTRQSSDLIACQELTARILDRINLVNADASINPQPAGKIETPAIDSAPMEWPDNFTDPRLNLMVAMLRQTIARVDALEAKNVHPADRMAAKLPEQWVTVYKFPDFWGIVIRTRDQVIRRVVLEHGTGDYNDREFAAKDARQYAADNGFEYRD